MAKLNWNRPVYVHNGVRAWDPPKKSKPIIGHDGHTLRSSLAKGPHYCKIVCETCNKFVKWGNNEDYVRYK